MGCNIGIGSGDGHVRCAQCTYYIIMYARDVGWPWVEVNSFENNREVVSIFFFFTEIPNNDNNVFLWENRIVTSPSYRYTFDGYRLWKFEKI